MYRAITTRYVGPTNSRGARVIARSVAMGTKAIAWNYEISPYQNHETAARTIACEECEGWRREDAPGAQLPDGSGYVFLFEF